MLTTSDESIYTYMDVATTEAMIVGLYSGHERREAGQPMGVAQTLHAYSWSGKFIGEWRLDQPLDAIVIAPEGRYLLGLRGTPERTDVLRFDITDVLESARRVTSRQRQSRS